MITNQKYGPPGKFSSIVFRYLNGKKENSYAGKCLGPGFGVLPADIPQEGGITVEWLNTTCTLYRTEALPTPLFPSIFHGASTCEDLALSLLVGEKWDLANVPQSKIYHDSQPGIHKNNARLSFEMEVYNRHYVMRHVLKQCGLSNYFKLFLGELFFLIGTLTSSKGVLQFPARSLGFARALFRILIMK